MKKIILLFFIFLSINIHSQELNQSFSHGEWLKYRVHYGIINAGYATLSIAEIKTDQNEQYHAVAKGWTTGILNWIFKVRDQYESFFDKEELLPNHFKRRVDEGGYTIKRDIYFDHHEKKALIEDHKLQKKIKADIGQIQDMVSAFYYLRTQKVDTLSIGHSLGLNLFFDANTFAFQLKYLGKERINTKFGKIDCYKMRPEVQAGRIFKKQESITMWISADGNKIPIRLKADLRVGSVKMDLEQYKGLSQPFPLIL